MRKYYLSLAFIAATAVAFAGNPDRQGEAGAGELLLNPFARSAGLHTMNTSYISGAEAMRLNVAGIGRINGLEINLSHMQYLVGTDIGMSAFGMAAPLGKGQAIGITLAAMSFGEIARTTVNSPEGDGSTFSPTFFHIGIGYSKTFQERVSVGVGLRFISEAIDNASATGFAIDAGVQYVSDDEDFKLGISLRNIGLGMRFSGDGIATSLPAEEGQYRLTVNQRVADFELPFALNIGASYDIYADAAEDNKIVILGNFTSNAYSRDNLGGGVEYAFRDLFMVRGGYRWEVGGVGETQVIQQPIYTGLAAGASVAIPLGPRNETYRRTIMMDYAYRMTRIYNGSHNISLRLML